MSNAAADVIAWWTQLYATTDAVQLASAGGHLFSIAYALRYAIAGDMAALKLTGGMSQRSNSYITTITRAHRHVITGLVFAVMTGIAQLAAQLAYLPRSPIFWTKMVMLVLLLANGRIIQMRGRRVSANDATAADMRDLRMAAIRSVALWCAMLILGLMLTTVPPDA